MKKIIIITGLITLFFVSLANAGGLVLLGGGLEFPDETVLTTAGDSLNIGTVTTSLPGSNASASITGTAPNQILNLTIPSGPVNTLSIGAVTSGTNASATITGTAPNQILNLTFPAATLATPPLSYYNGSYNCIMSIQNVGSAPVLFSINNGVVSGFITTPSGTISVSGSLTTGAQLSASSTNIDFNFSGVIDPNTKLIIPGNVYNHLQITTGTFGSTQFFRDILAGQYSSISSFVYQNTTYQTNDIDIVSGTTVTGVHYVYQAGSNTGSSSTRTGVIDLTTYKINGYVINGGSVCTTSGYIDSSSNGKLEIEWNNIDCQNGTVNTVHI